MKSMEWILILWIINRFRHGKNRIDLIDRIEQVTLHPNQMLQSIFSKNYEHLKYLWQTNMYCEQYVILIPNYVWHCRMILLFPYLCHRMRLCSLYERFVSIHIFCFGKNIMLFIWPFFLGISSSLKDQGFEAYPGQLCM